MSGGLVLGGGGGGRPPGPRGAPCADTDVEGRTAAEGLESVDALLFAGDGSLRSSLTRSLSLFFFFFFRSDPSADAPSTELSSCAFRFSALTDGSCRSILIPPTSITLVFDFFSPILSALSGRSGFLASSVLRLSG